MAVTNYFTMDRETWEPQLDYQSDALGPMAGADRQIDQLQAACNPAESCYRDFEPSRNEYAEGALDVDGKPYSQWWKRHTR